MREELKLLKKIIFELGLLYDSDNEVIKKRFNAKDLDKAEQFIKDNYIEKEKVDIEEAGVDEAYCMWYKCKNCGDDMITKDSVYCPSCGRKIRITN